MIFQYIIIKCLKQRARQGINIIYDNHDRKPSQCAGVAGLLNVEPASFLHAPLQKPIAAWKQNVLSNQKEGKHENDKILFVYP